METVSTGVIEWAVAELVLPGQTQSGDRCLVTAPAEGGLVAVVDGRGDGAAAAAAAPRRGLLLLRGGVVGLHLPGLAAAILPVARGDVLILATDGVRNNCSIDPFAHGDSPQQLADRILAGWGTKTDDALVLVAR